MANDVGKAEALSDSELVDRCLLGDESAWTQLIARYQRLIYSIARTLCRDPDDIADVFQYTCLDLYRGLPELRDIKALPAWLITVTRRRAVSVLKTRILVSDSEEAGDITPQSSVDLIKVIEHEHAIERALRDLPERCRDLIELLYFTDDEPSYVAISKKLGMPVASIGPTRARCLEKLKRLLS